MEEKDKHLTKQVKMGAQRVFYLPLVSLSFNRITYNPQELILRQFYDLLIFNDTFSN